MNIEDKNKRLEELRSLWRQATPEERKLIEQEAGLLKEKRGFQCYFVDKNGTQCKKEQGGYFCSEEHKNAWQAENYQDFRPKGEHQLSIKEMQERLLEMKAHAKEKRFKEQQELL